MSEKKSIMDYETVALDDEKHALVIIDQTKLPYEMEMLELTKQEDIWNAIYLLQVRGAPAIGVSAAIGIYLAAREIEADTWEEFYPQFTKAKEYLDSARPTAVNLSWALNRMDEVCRASKEKPIREIVEILHDAALEIRDEDVWVCKSIGEYGLSLVKPGDGLLTQAFETVLAFPDPVKAAAAAKCLAGLAGYQGMVGGQCVDLSAGGQEVTIGLLKEMDQGKTVALIDAACRMGCIAAGAGEAQLAAASRYAQGVGMAFQIRDDILDVLGDAETLGKNTGMDAARDKRNYVSLLGVETAQELVESYTGQAVDALGIFPQDQSFLAELAQALANRDS